MIIPIPSKHKRFKVDLGLFIKQPSIVKIYAYDPTRPHADYERKTIRFNQTGKWNKTLNFPVSPQKAVVEIINQSSSGNKGFELVKFNLSPLPKPTSWSKSAQDQFMKFAIDFSQTLGSKKVGFYASKNQDYLFQLLPSIQDELGNELSTPARISRIMPRVQINREIFKTYTIPVRVAILAHEGCHWFLNTRSQQEADLCGLKYFLDYGFTKKQAHASVDIFDNRKGFDPFGQSMSSERGQVARTFINNYKPHTTHN